MKTFHMFLARWKIKIWSEVTHFQFALTSMAEQRWYKEFLLLNFFSNKIYVLSKNKGHISTRIFVFLKMQFLGDFLSIHLWYLIHLIRDLKFFNKGLYSINRLHGKKSCKKRQAHYFHFNLTCKSSSHSIQG